jgi:hypothetical protein
VKHNKWDKGYSFILNTNLLSYFLCSTLYSASYNSLCVFFFFFLIKYIRFNIETNQTQSDSCYIVDGW